MLNCERLCDRGTTSGRIPDDTRSEFERDYHRVAFCGALRRLEHKTQAFPLETIDVVRNRLTHTIEVTSVARGLTQAVARKLHAEGDLDLQQVLDVTTIAATCGLVHDLGNPPFGHAGEDAIRTWFQKHEDLLDFASHPESERLKQDFLQFEGNAQTLRLLLTLQTIAHLDGGLNLTCGTLAAAMKYVAPSNGTNGEKQERKKAGYFFSEDAAIARIRNSTGLQDRRHPIAYLVEAADDCAYLATDLEDAVMKGFVSWQDLKHALKTAAGERDQINTLIEKAECLVRTGNAHFDGHAQQTAFARAMRHYFVSQGAISAVATFLKHYTSIMDGDFHGSLLDSAEAFRPIIDAFKLVANEHVYNSPHILRLELFGRNAIHALMDAVWEGVCNHSPEKKKDRFAFAAYRLLSGNYRQIFESVFQSNQNMHAGLQQYYKLRLVTDQLSGMTDTFATDWYRRIFGGDP